VSVAGVRSENREHHASPWANDDACSFEALSDGAAVHLLGQNVQSYTAAGIAAGFSACIAVVAYNAQWASAYSPWSCGFALPNPPSGISVLSQTTTSVTFGFTRPDPYSGVVLTDGGPLQVVSGTQFTSTRLNGGYACIDMASYNPSGASGYTGWFCGLAH